MAGDYIPFDHDFPEKPEVTALSQDTGVTICDIMLRCHKLWREFDRHTPDGFLENVGPKGLGILCGGDEAFWIRFAEMGWLIFRDDGCEMVGFAARLDRGKGCAYKRMRSDAQLRARAADRKRRQRQRDKGRDTPRDRKRDKGRDPPVTSSVTPPVTNGPQLPVTRTIRTPTPFPPPRTETATNRGGEGGGDLDMTGGKGPSWDDAEDALKSVGVRTADQLAETAAKKGFSADQVIGLVQVYRLNAAKLELGPGAIDFRIRRGDWPADGVKSLEEAKQKAEAAGPTYLEQIDEQERAFQADREGARAGVKEVLAALKAKPPKPEEET